MKKDIGSLNYIYLFIYLFILFIYLFIYFKLVPLPC